MHEISALSKEYVRATISAREAGVPVNPTADIVKMAFTLLGTDPVTNDFKDASWETDGGTYYARCLVGPGGTIALPKETYEVWVKVTDNPEVPVLYAGKLNVI